MSMDVFFAVALSVVGSVWIAVQIAEDITDRRDRKRRAMELEVWLEQFKR